MIRSALSVAAAAAVLAVGIATGHAASRALAVGATVSVPSQFRTLGVAAGDGAVWATDGTATLTRVDPAGQGVAASIPVADADLVAVVGSSVWVVGSNSIATRIDAQTNAILSKVRVAQDPTGVATGDGALWVAGRSATAITRVDAVSGKVAARIPTPETARYVAVGAGAVWAASNESPTIWRIDPRSNKVVASISLSDTPNGIAATAAGVWVLGATNDRVVRINPRSNKVAGYTPIPKADGFIGYGGAITAHTTAVWVATLTHLLQLDPRSGHVLAAVAVGTHPNHDPVGLTSVSSGPSGLWVADGDGKAVNQITHS